MTWKAKLVLILCLPLAGILVVLTAIPAVFGMALELIRGRDA